MRTIPDAAGMPNGRRPVRAECQVRVPPGSPSINNNNFVGNAINPVTYQGIRVSALWDINGDWKPCSLKAIRTSTPKACSIRCRKAPTAYRCPAVVTLFNPSYNKDKFENTAWTVNGEIGDLKLVYTGAYLVRNVSQVQDYTNYSRGLYADYYQCHGAEPTQRPGCDLLFAEHHAGTRPSATRTRVMSCD